MANIPDSTARAADRLALASPLRARWKSVFFGRSRPLDRTAAATADTVHGAGARAGML